MASKSDSFTVPQAVRNNAKRGLELRREHGRGGLDTRQAKKEGVGSGVARARDLMGGSVSYETVKRMLAFFNRHKAFKEHHSDKTSAAYISWMIWGGDAGFAWAKRIVAQVEKVEKGSFRALALFGEDYPEPEIEDVEETEEPLGSFSALLKAAKEPKVPAKYLEGLTGEEREKRKREIQRRMKGKDRGEKYGDIPGDKDAKTKPSKYSKTDFAEKVRAEIKKTGKDEFLRAAAKVSGISRSILEQVYNRGAEAWATSGRRPGASQEAWAKARVYSFATGGKTQKTADKDLWEKHTKKSLTAIGSEGVVEATDSTFTEMIEKARGIPPNLEPIPDGEEFEYNGPVIPAETPADAIKPTEPLLTPEQIMAVANAETDEEAEAAVKKAVVEIDLNEDYVSPNRFEDSTQPAPQAPPEPEPQPELQVVVNAKDHSALKKCVKGLRGSAKIDPTAQDILKNIMKGRWSKIDMKAVARFLTEDPYSLNAKAVGGAVMMRLIRNAKVKTPV